MITELKIQDKSSCRKDYTVVKSSGYFTRRSNNFNPFTYQVFLASDKREVPLHRGSKASWRNFTFCVEKCKTMGECIASFCMTTAALFWVLGVEA